MEVPERKQPENRRDNSQFEDLPIDSFPFDYRSIRSPLTYRCDLQTNSVQH